MPKGWWTLVYLLIYLRSGQFFSSCDIVDNIVFGMRNVWRRPLWRNFMNPAEFNTSIGNADHEPELLNPHQCWTLLMLLWLNGSKSQQQCSKCLGKAQ